MLKDIARIFVLQGYLVDSIKSEDEQVIISLRSPRNRLSCIFCGVAVKRVHQHRERKVKHGLIEDKLVILKIKYRRFLCRSCGKTFAEPLPNIDRKRVSDHGRERIITELANQSFQKTAQQFSISEASVNRYLLEGFAKYHPDWEGNENGLSIGIDEHSFRGHDMVTTITNLSKRKLAAILKDDSQKTISGYLSNLPINVKERVSEVCMDMRFGFRTVVEKELPDAKIVVDPFHVVSAANNTIDELRRVLLATRDWHPKIRRLLLKNKENLTFEENLKLIDVFERLRKFPSLEIAWRAKEKLRDMYHAKDKNEATHKFNLVLAYLSDTDSGYLKVFRGTLERWKDYILNHFDNRTTNAFTEGCHTKIKLTKRMSYGFKNVNNYIAKMMLAFLPFLALIHHHF